MNKDAEIADAKFPAIRMFTVGRAAMAEPQENCVGTWEVCTSEVVRLYLSRCQQERTLDGDKDIVITRVTVHDSSGPRTEFESDGKMYVTVEARARRRHHDMSVVIAVVDQHQYLVFDTCTQRLGRGPIALEAGETLSCTFELDVTLAGGTFHVNAFLHRYTIGSAYDRWTLATTFFVASTLDARGIVTMHPRLLACEVGKV